MAPILHSSHDALTVTEIFARRAYATGKDVRVVVDIGANIGLSLLYFLSRNHHVRAYAFEPVPFNLERLEDNISPFRARCTLFPVAVAVADGEATFGVEPTGRYSGIGVEGEPMPVRCQGINNVLRDVLSEEGFIDVLKIDIEGLEEAVLAAIDPTLLDHIDTIYYETPTPRPINLDRFRHSFELQANKLKRRDTGRPRYQGTSPGSS